MAAGAERGFFAWRQSGDRTSVRVSHVTCKFPQKDTNLCGMRMSRLVWIERRE